MSGIVWENPSPAAARTRASKYDDLVTQLRRHPGRWAVFSEATSNSTAAAIKSGKITAFRPAGDYDATSQTVGGGKVKVWVRYIGNPRTNRDRLTAIRAWAVTNGWDIANRGRIPKQIINAYDAAQEGTD